MPAISALANISRSTIAAGAVVSSSENNTWSAAVVTAVNNLNSVASDLQSNYASASAPTDKPAGKWWYDSSNTLWKGYKTASGTPVTFLESSLAYTLDLATAGTATFRLGGVINSDPAQYSKAGSTGVLATYTLPGGTLARNNQFVHVVAFGTKTGTTATMSLQPRFGTTAITTHTMAANCTDWAMEFWIVRTGAATQDCGSFMILNRDDTGSTTLCDFATASKTLSGDLAIDINVSSVNAADGATQELFIVEFGNA